MSAVVPQLGLPPIRHERILPHRARDTKKKSDDVTWRHKKWLGEFQERRLAIEATMQDRVRAQDERARRLAERSQAMRDTIRGIKNGPGEKEEKTAAIGAALTGKGKASHLLPTEYVDVSHQYPSGAPQPQPRPYEVHDADEILNPNASSQPQPQQQPISSNVVPPSSQPSARAVANGTQPSSKKSSKSSAATAKPGWARTEAEDDEFMDAEADSLLDFAAGLDYQKYIDDLEVREAIKFVQDRVKLMETNKQTAEAEEEERQRLIQAGELEEVFVVDDDAGLDENGEKQYKKIVRRVKKNRQPIQVLHNENWNSSTTENENGLPSERDLSDQLTRTVLDSNRHMRNIHSSASVRAIVEKEKSGGGGPAVGTGATTLRRTQLGAIVEGGEQRPPIITTIHEKDGPQNKGPNPSNLPFLYRHPGI